MHELGALVSEVAPEVVVEMEASSMVRHMGHGLVETAFDRLNGVEVL